MGKLTKKVGNCVVGIALDGRKSIGERYKLAIRFTIGTKRLYYHLGDLLTQYEFDAIIAADYERGRPGQPGSPKEIHRSWSKMLDDYAERVKELASITTISLDKIKTMLTGKSSVNNFISVWDDVISSRRAGTAECYRIARNSFMKCFGLASWNGINRNEAKIEELGFSVDSERLHKWVQYLTDKGISKTTIGMYLRACRVVVNECCRRGFMAKDKSYPFGERDNDKVSVPRGKNRKHESLTVEKMTELYNVFLNKAYPDGWSETYRKEAHESLGLFLFMYLANGMNLADVARLTYEDFYRRTKGKAFRFERLKTKDRTDDNSEVIVPITPQLRRIMDEMAAPCEIGERIFPSVLRDAVTDHEIMRRVQQENQNIRKRLRNLVEAMGWTEEISPTWCRHSFATNLIQQGVPQQYVSESMGHSTGGNVTMGYVGRYPLDKQMEYNRMLLTAEHENDGQHDVVGDILSGLSKEQKEKLLHMLLTEND